MAVGLQQPGLAQMSPYYTAKPLVYLAVAAAAAMTPAQWWQQTAAQPRMEHIKSRLLAPNTHVHTQTCIHTYQLASSI